MEIFSVLIRTALRSLPSARPPATPVPARARVPALVLTLALAAVLPASAATDAANGPSPAAAGRTVADDAAGNTAAGKAADAATGTDAGAAAGAGVNAAPGAGAGAAPGSAANAGAGAGADAHAGADAARAADIVRRADAVRFPEDSFQVLVRVESVSAGKPLEPRVYRIFSKGNENTIVQTLEPAIERGQNMLMRSRDLWIFMPSVSQPVRLSLSQRLTGQVANGDLARANFAGDYTATLTGSETINGAEHYVLELVAAQRGVTYPKVVYRVRKSDHRPYDAQFYSVSGRLLKTCAWEEFGRLGDRVRPTKLVMTDALKPDDVSVMRYSDLQRVKIPDRYFTKEFMKRLE